MILCIPVCLNFNARRTSKLYLSRVIIAYISGKNIFLYIYCCSLLFAYLKILTFNACVNKYRCAGNIQFPGASVFKFIRLSVPVSQGSCRVEHRNNHNSHIRKYRPPHIDVSHCAQRKACKFNSQREHYILMHYPKRFS